MSDLHEILLLVELHHKNNPDHGIDCVCCDKWVQQVRKLFQVSEDPRTQRRINYVLRAALGR